MTNRREIHERVLTAGSKEELAVAYSEWADAYDRDLVDEMGYIAHSTAAHTLQNSLADRTANILDTGCGTGLVGAILYDLGYRNIDGLDYSAEMLDKAKDKNVYRSLLQGDLTARLEIADNTYDAVICVGTFTCGHVGPEAFMELVRIIKPGGHICFTVREEAWESDPYQRQIDEMEKSGLWRLKDQQNRDYIREEGSRCIICLLQITPRTN